MRQINRSAVDIELPTRYCLTEPRFRGGHETLRNEEEANHEPTTHLA